MSSIEQVPRFAATSNAVGDTFVAWEGPNVDVGAWQVQGETFHDDLVPWVLEPRDAGAAPDDASTPDDATAMRRDARAAGGCACGVTDAPTSSPMPLVLALAVARRRRRR